MSILRFEVCDVCGNLNEVAQLFYISAGNTDELHKVWLCDEHSAPLRELLPRALRPAQSKRKTPRRFEDSIATVEEIRSRRDKQ